jgi:acyl-coenzyme A synthetase/AMP-(fatty) acid ligase/alkanesulfonate monooxygenase SsuD/methylene tetrahydromethanopterin reductase-like flavin-dependent oxidoreductase (luciferase family)
MQRVRIGVRVPQYGSTWSEVREAALHVERLGFDGVWVNDHLQSPGRIKREPTFDALTTLAALASITDRARLGVAVLSASYRPAALAAKMTTVLDVISGGRLVVGLGTGSDRAEHAAYGYRFGTPGERTAGLIDALEVMQAMRRDPDGAMPNRPAAHPPVWLAAHKPRLLRHAGERADGVIVAWVPPEEFAARRTLAEDARLAAGRPALAYCLYTFAFAYRSEREAHGWLAAEAEALGSTPAAILRWLRTTGIVGTVGEVRDRLADYTGAGATDAVLALPSRVPAEAVEVLADATLTTPVPPRRRAPATDRARANLVDALVERHRRDGRGGDVAVVDDHGGWSYDELDEASGRAAGRMREAGVRAGQRVAVVLPDSREWCAAFLGAARLGAVAIPLEPAGRHTADTLIDLDVAATVSAGPDELADPSGWIDPAGLADGRYLPIAPVHAEDLAYMIFSSGSTGRPKGAMHAHRDLDTSIEGYARAVLGLAPGDRSHSVARLFASLGFGNGFFRPLGLGATCVMSAIRPTVRSVLDVVARHGVTVLSGVPTFWAQLATFLERHPDPAALRSVRLAVSSGDALPAAVAEHLRAVTGMEIVEGLGCSECSNIVISTRPGEAMPGALGRAVPGVELRLADDEGRPVPAGTPGRLWIKSPSNTSGYWRRSDETRELVYGPWVRMGDVLREDEGVFRHLGRADDLFKVDAKWVSPVEVEAALHEHPDVAEAAVVGRPDGEGLMRPVAFVVLTGRASGGPDLRATLRRHVAHRLAPHMAPVEVTLVGELPRGATGKVDRRALREGRLSEAASGARPEPG